MKEKSLFMAAAFMLAAGLFWGQFSGPVKYDNGTDPGFSQHPFVLETALQCMTGEYRLDPETGIYMDVGETAVWIEGYCITSTKGMSSGWSCGGTGPKSFTCTGGKVCQDGACVTAQILCLHDECAPVVNGSCSGGCTTAPVISCNTGYTRSGSSCVCAYGNCTSIANGSCSGGCTSAPAYSCSNGYSLSGTVCVANFNCSSCTGGKRCNGSSTACENTPAGVQGNCSTGYVANGSGSCVCKYSSCSSVSNGTCSGGCTSEPAYSCNGGYAWNGSSCSSTFSCSSCTNGKKCNASSTACENAPQGDTASCSSGQVATGSGSCVTKATCNSSCGTYTYNTCTLNSIQNGQYSASDCGVTCNDGYTWNGSSCGTAFSCSSCTGGTKCNSSSSACQNCSYGESCGCPSGQISNGSGSCISSFSCSSCTGGTKCNSSSTACENCSVGTQCNCSSGQVANGSGSCIVKPTCNSACSSYNSSNNTCTLGYIANGQYTDAATCAVQCSGGYKLSPSGKACNEMVKQPDMIKKC